MHLKGSAGVAASFRQPLKPPAAQACRTFKIAFPAQKFLTAGSEGVQRPVCGQECGPPGKIGIPEISRENRLLISFIGTEYRRSRYAAQRSKQPVCIIGGRDPAMPRAMIGQAKPDDLDRIVDRHKYPKILL